jgi:hypothetical protein
MIIFFANDLASWSKTLPTFPLKETFEQKISFKKHNWRHIHKTMLDEEHMM